MLVDSLKCGLFLSCALLLTSTVACGDDGGSEGDAETASETAESGDTAAEGATTDMGDGDGDAGDGDGDTGDGDGDGDTGDGDGDTGNPDCVDIEAQAECDDHPDCQSVLGSRLKGNGPDSPCLEPIEFLGCIPMMACDDAETWFCQGNSSWLVSDSCGPDGADMCQGPDMPVSDCP